MENKQMLTENVRKYIDNSVLCWLATSGEDNSPNVSPKEMFTHFGNDKILIAHLASPVSVANIEVNPRVCVSFVDVFVQKGYKLKGTAELIAKDHNDFPVLLKQLTDLFSDRFPIKAVIRITVTSVAPIQAPSYFLYPEITEETQKANAMATYQVKPLQP